MGTCQQEIGEKNLEEYVKVSRSTLVDFRRLLGICSRVPSQFGKYQIGKLLIDVKTEGVNVCLLRKSNLRLPFRIKPEFYETVYSHLVAILRESQYPRVTWLLILEYLKGLINAQASQGTKRVNKVSAQIHDLNPPPLYPYGTGLDRRRDTLSKVESIS